MAGLENNKNGEESATAASARSATTQNRDVPAKQKLLDAALQVFREQGYTATSVDDICARAGVTKGSFFYHFKSKEELAIAAVHFWNEWTSTLFANADYHKAADPRDRVLGYVDLRAQILSGAVPEYTCLLGTLVQEVYQTHPSIRTACDEGLNLHITALTKDLEEARRQYAPDAPWSAQSVGYFIQSVLQGAFIFAKAEGGNSHGLESIAHLRRYLAFLFTPNQGA